MNILVVHGRQINAYPPVITLIEVLLQLGHNVTLISRNDTNDFKDTYPIKFIKIPEGNNGRVRGAISYFEKKIFMQNAVKEEMKNNDILWTTTDTTVRELGNLVLNYKHIMQLLELIEILPAFPGQEVIRFDVKKVARAAYKVVVPEYNRAHIQKTWFGLDHTPVVLPNKMILREFDAIPSNVKEALDKLSGEGKKIILYQGVFTPDRNLDHFAEAFQEIKDQYAFYIMGKDLPYRRELSKKYSDIKYISFIKPPYHLCVTQMAYIGLLPYVAGKSSHNSILNGLYCAPNKIFEYAAYGLPMIGSDVPGLYIPFSQYNIGKVCKKQNREEIIRCVEEIESDYELMSDNCLKFYQSVDIKKIVSDILT